MHDDLFERPAQWRAEAVGALGLDDDDLIAGLITGAGYPDALVPVADAMRVVDAPVWDVGAGLGAATVWLGDHADVSVFGLEPEPGAARLAAATFVGLRVVAGTATAIPLRSASCGGVALLGVVSLVDDLGPVVAEVRRVLRDDGVVAFSDLWAVDAELRRPHGSPNVFRTVDQLGLDLEAATFRVEVVWRAPALRPTAWDDVGRRVDDEIERRHGGSEVFRRWQADRQRLRDLIEGGELEVATICGRLRA